MSDDHIAEVKQLQRRDGNKKCADCGDNTLYVISKYNIFVCHRCAGIHRAFLSGMYVKGLTTAIFSRSVVEALRAGGNRRSEAHLMATHDPSECPRPTHDSPPEEIKRFVQLKYLDRAWAGVPTATPNLTRVDTPRPSKLSKPSKPSKPSRSSRSSRGSTPTTTTTTTTTTTNNNNNTNNNNMHNNHNDPNNSPKLDPTKPSLATAGDEFWGLFGLTPATPASAPSPAPAPTSATSAPSAITNTPTASPPGPPPASPTPPAAAPSNVLSTFGQRVPSGCLASEGGDSFSWFDGFDVLAVS